MPNLVNLYDNDIDSEYQIHGYEAFDASGEKLGRIDSVIADDETMQPRYVVVDSGGWFSSKKFVVPAGDIREMDDDKRHLSFKSLTKSTLESGTYPRYDESWWDGNNGQEFATHERQVARAYQPARAEAQAVDYSDTLYQRPEQGAQRLQLMEERLRVQKQQEQAGAVRIGKRITERTETVNVPLREERVIIERTAASGRPVEGGVELKDGQTIEVPVMRETATANKEAVVTEEVHVRKEVTEREERVSDTVRKEELVVDGDQNLVSDGGRATERSSQVAGNTAGRTGQSVADGAVNGGANGKNIVERAADKVGDAAEGAKDKLTGRS